MMWNLFFKITKVSIISLFILFNIIKVSKTFVTFVVKTISRKKHSDFQDSFYQFPQKLRYL